MPHNGPPPLSSSLSFSLSLSLSLSLCLDLSSCSSFFSIFHLPARTIEMELHVEFGKTPDYVLRVPFPRSIFHLVVSCDVCRRVRRMVSDSNGFNIQQKKINFCLEFLADERNFFKDIVV